MEQLIIQIKDKPKAKYLIDFLKTLDFIKIIENGRKSKSKKVNHKSDWRSLRGSLKGSSLTTKKFAQYKVEEKKLER